ncbi:unnamed protein product, partial [Choristocarpus tenellus]
MESDFMDIKTTLSLSSPHCLLFLLVSPSGFTIQVAARGMEGTDAASDLLSLSKQDNLTQETENFAEGSTASLRRGIPLDAVGVVEVRSGPTTTSAREELGPTGQPCAGNSSAQVTKKKQRVNYKEPESKRAIAVECYTQAVWTFS